MSDMASPSGPKRRILVIDDHKAVRRLAERILVGAGYEVVTAGNGAEATEACRHGAFDLFLSDIVMPDTDGESLVERLRTTQPRVVVLFMSGYAEGPAFAFEDGATLPKPFTRDGLLRGVQETLAHGS
jgi:CheY-like chemotaxis protein